MAPEPTVWGQQCPRTSAMDAHTVCPAYDITAPVLDLITFQAPTEIRERSSASIRVAFRDGRARADIAPTNVYYRLDDDGTGIVLADWTSVTVPVLPTNYVDIVLTPEQNRVLRESRELERKTISVMTDRDLSTQFVASYTYAVRNLAWLS